MWQREGEILDQTLKQDKFQEMAWMSEALAGAHCKKSKIIAIF
jgi:hypothetical protein